MTKTAVEDLKIYFVALANSGQLDADPSNLSDQQTAEKTAQRDSRQATVIVYKRLLLDVYEVCIYHRGKRYSAAPHTTK